MVAVLGWTDGIGNDTYVAGIFPNMEQAQAWAKTVEPWGEGMKTWAAPAGANKWVFQSFDFGPVDFDFEKVLKEGA